MLKMDEIRQLIRATTNSSDQRQYSALQALGTVEGGLEELRKYGFFFGLAQGVEHEPQEWPKMVYKQGQEPQIVESEDEFKDLGEGWSHELPKPQDKKAEDTPSAPAVPRGQEPRDPGAVQGGQATDPLLLANDKAREEGRQARKDGKALEEAPEGTRGDAWRAGFAEVAAQEDAKVADSGAKPEEIVPVAAGAPNDPTKNKPTSNVENKTASGKTRGA